MGETERFVNEGGGWECRRCRAEDSKGHEGDAGEARPSSSDTLARFFREGESEERELRLSTPALARWKDSSRRALVCPRCGVEEELSA